MKNSTTSHLEEVLRHTPPEKIPDFTKEYEDKLLTSERPFRDYMLQRLAERGMQQQTLFLNADISEGYGYKLLTEEKHTVQRDVILRLCLGASFTVEETNRALTLYGMAPLYSKLHRDAVLISAISAERYDVYEVDVLLTENGESPLYSCR